MGRFDYLKYHDPDFIQYNREYFFSYSQINKEKNKKWLLIFIKFFKKKTEMKQNLLKFR